MFAGGARAASSRWLMYGTSLWRHCLANSENPAHTQWQKTSSNFKNKYVYGQAHIEFVSRAVERIVAIIRDTGEEHDVTTLADIFPRPADDDGPRPSADAPSQKPKPDVTTTTLPPSIKSTPLGYRLRQVAGGFSVQQGRPGVAVPASLRVKVAYDIRQGNPLKRYNSADFRLDQRPIEIVDRVGVAIRECSTNELLFDVTSPDFTLTLGGFDKNRDLYVNVSVAEVGDAAAV